MPDRARLTALHAIEEKVLWLAVWMIHHANHVRPKLDGLKVGGHQASSASVVTLMTALYFDVLKPWDRVAVKPHASPVFHAIQYLFGRQTREKLERFRALGGAQSYPSRTKDADDVDFSTGSVGPGRGAHQLCGARQEYLRTRAKAPSMPAGRMIALLGDAEFDEGNVFEALYKGWKHDIRNVWWVIDYNRQSLDAVVSDRIFQRMDSIFRAVGWNVVTLKYGRLMRAAFAEKGGDALREWIDECPNSLVLGARVPGRRRLAGAARIRSRACRRDPAAARPARRPALHALMTNLAGHDLETVIDAFRRVDDDVPTCFIAYTIKGYGLPFAAHKDNHAGLMTPEQMAALQRRMNIRDGEEWEPLAGIQAPARRCGGDLGRAVQSAVPPPPAGAGHCRARTDRLARRRTAVDAGGLRTAARQHRA